MDSALAHRLIGSFAFAHRLIGIRSSLAFAAHSHSQLIGIRRLIDIRIKYIYTSTHTRYLFHSPKHPIF